MSDTESTETRESLSVKEFAEADLAKAASVMRLAEAGRFEAERRKFEIEAAGAEIVYRRLEREEKETLVGDKYNHIFQFNEVVTSSSAKVCMNQLATWDRLEEGCSIEISFNSPGGEIIAGMAMFDFIQEIRAKDHRVTTSTRGMAASMAGILLMAGDHRVMGKEAWLLIHEASFGAAGSMGSVEDTVEWVKRIQKRILNIFASRSKLSSISIGRKWKRKDWWISSDEALKWGFVDEVRGN